MLPLPFGPSMDGIGLRRALAIGMRGTPWMTRGSFIRVRSSFAGTFSLLAVFNFEKGGDLLRLITAR